MIWMLLGGGVALALLVTHLVTVGLYLWRSRATQVLHGVIGQPKITLLRPVCGLDAFDAETLESSFWQDYPDYEIIFCAPRATDAAVPLVRRLIDAHPERHAQLLVGQVAHTGNPKLNNLWKGWDAAVHDWVCMTDSNLLLPPDYLSTLVAAWGPNTGLVSSPPVGIRPDGIGGHLECAFLNSNQARWQFAAGRLGHAFAQGKTLFWNKPMVDGAGGLAILGRHLAEDVSSTKLVRGLGLRVSLPPMPFAQPIGRRSLRQVWDRQLRWSRVRRDGFPLLFAGEVTNGAACGAVLAALVGGPVAVLGYVGLWWGAEVWLMHRAAHWPHGWRDVAVLPLRDALLPALWCATFLRRGFEWRGTAMTTVEEPAT
jgi:ceramide glucosyltransferase